MKGYTRSYILGGILIVAAFVALFVELKSGGLVHIQKKRYHPSWVLFVGGAILVIYGWREQRGAYKKEKKR